MPTFFQTNLCIVIIATLGLAIFTISRGMYAYIPIHAGLLAIQIGLLIISIIGRT